MENKLFVRSSWMSLVPAMLLLFINAASSPVFSEEHSHEDILHTAQLFVQQYYSQQNSEPGLEVHIKPPDSRLNLQQCSTRPVAFWPYSPGNGRNVSVGVRCEGNSPWKLYLQSEIKLLRSVPVLNTAVRAGAVLEKSMVTMRQVNLLQLRSPALDMIEPYIGMKISRSLQAGVPLSKSILEMPATIKRGDHISILSGKGVVQVAAKGYALNDGYLNDTIKVRNVDSKKVIQALVVDQGYVRTMR